MTDKNKIQKTLLLSAFSLDVNRQKLNKQSRHELNSFLHLLQVTLLRIYCISSRDPVMDLEAASGMNLEAVEPKFQAMSVPRTFTSLAIKMS